jgi:hypothetical protein
MVMPIMVIAMMSLPLMQFFPAHPIDRFNYNISINVGISRRLI